MNDADLPKAASAPPAQARREHRLAEERRILEAREAGQRARERTRRAVPARRPATARPGHRQLRKPNFLRAATAGISDVAAAQAALAAMKALDHAG